MENPFDTDIATIYAPIFKLPCKSKRSWEVSTIEKLIADSTVNGVQIPFDQILDLSKGTVFVPTKKYKPGSDPTAVYYNMFEHGKSLTINYWLLLRSMVSPQWKFKLFAIELKRTDESSIPTPTCVYFEYDDGRGAWKPYAKIQTQDSRPIVYVKGPSGLYEGPGMYFPHGPVNDYPDVLNYNTIVDIEYGIFGNAYKNGVSIDYGLLPQEHPAWNAHLPGTMSVGPLSGPDLVLLFVAIIVSCAIIYMLVKKYDKHSTDKKYEKIRSEYLQT